MVSVALEKRREHEEDFNSVCSKQDGSFAKDIPAYFVGGRFNGLYLPHDELMKRGNGRFSPRWSAMKVHNPLTVNLDLEDQPKVNGYVGPMLDGGFLRYETQEMYDILSR